ncbi:kinetochore protein Nuf2 [Apodemus sylvaticus]|uniref:kinetochore protein Nuf2 n=1 Tax=Apodemus sylvaticus TaxID=10129 RepID=UPI0022427604|nr:kinetochore protein Nuf2 [Apodemus sylvaticus]XP_052056355.1 kinetochore protein Nuf2 [Apodemus sylvaticus]XP_052056356.1 kinetochore protein Nuf2 [Apodemus sylvaticus]
METLSFPRYNVPELVVHIRNKLLTGSDAKNLSKNDFLPNPKCDVLYMIYMKALQLVYGVRLEHFSMMPVNIDVMYPHIMEGFLPVSNLLFHMDSFMPICRVNDFEIADIIHPKVNRTSRFLSGIINFIGFRETCLEKYEEFLLQSKSSMDKMQQLSNAHQEALMKLEKLNLVPVEEQEEFKQLMDDIQELQHLLNQDFRQKTMLLQEGYAKMKSDISEKTKHFNELKLSIVSLKEVQENLKSKIVDSPEKLKNYKEKMKDTVQKLRSAREEVMEKYDIYRDSVDCLPSCQLEVQLYQKKSQDLADNREKLSSILKESLNLEDQIESDSSELKKLKTEENSLSRLLMIKKEKLASTHFKINKKQEDVKQYKRTVIEDCNKVQEKRDAVCEQVTNINQDIHKVKSRIQQLRDATKREKLKSQEIFVNLKSALEKYHESIEKTTEECCARVEEKTAELKKRMFRIPP